MRGLCALVVAVLAIACGGRDAYRCATSDQCVGNGMAGVCEPSGFCSFADGSCPSGRKYEDHAGGGLAGTCVVVDAGIDAPEVTPTCVTDVAYGRHFGCVRKENGTVWCVGENNEGQIGFGLPGATNVVEWMQVREAGTSLPIADATGIGAGWEHACAIRTGGTVWCWGRNTGGQLGNNTNTGSAAAVQVRKEVDDAPLTDVVQVGGGLDFTCARDTGDEVWCWGHNERNQIGDNTTLQRTRAVAVLTGAAEMTVGRESTCARKANDEIYCWGRNSDGMFGDGTAANKPVPTLLGTAKAIELGHYAACRIELDDTVACAGSPWRLRLGTGAYNATPRVTTPTRVLTGKDQPPLAGVAQLVMGGASCARLTDGTVQCWSDNTHGQSGVGMVAPYPRTVRRADGSPLDGVDKLWAGFSHLCARRAGVIECWGRGLNGEWGDGKLEDRGAAAPLEVPCP